MIFFWGFIVLIIAVILIGIAIYLVSQKIKRAYFQYSLRLRALTVRPKNLKKLTKTPG